jgi:hypothetical protein
VKQQIRVLGTIGIASSVLLAAVACFLLLAGCEFTAADENGKQRTAAEWEERAERVRRQVETDTKQALAAKDAEVARVLAESAAAAAAAKSEAEMRRKRFDAEVAKLQAQAGMELADLTLIFEQGEAESAARLAATLANLNARAQEIDRATASRIDQNAATVAEASAQTEAALQRIEEKQARIMGGLKFAEGAASTFGGPLGATLVSVLGTGGIGGLIFGASQRKKALNIEAEKNRREATTKDIFLALEHIKGVDAEFKAKLKQHKEALNDWMGQDGIKLVNELTA